MTQTLELMLESARRQVQSDTEYVLAWDEAEGVDLEAMGAALSGLLTRVIAIYELFEELDRLMQNHGGQDRPNALSAKNSGTLVKVFDTFRRLADLALRWVDKIPPDHRPRLERIAELKRLRDSAIEMAGVYRGEAQYFSGAPFSRWEDVRSKLGV